MPRTHKRWRIVGVAVMLFVAAFGLRAWRGSAGLHGNLNWDERYALDNVRSLLETGSFRPAKSYYPSPVFNLPATALVAAAEAWHERTGDPRWDAYDNGRFLRMTYRLCRWLMALYGAIAVLLLWRIGHQLAGEGVGLLAAILLTFLPWHLFSSSVFKPDSLLTMSVLFTFWAALHAVRRASLGWAALAGLGIALAASAKLTGVLVAAPVALGLLAAGPRQRRRWAQLALAAGVSAAAFVALNPYWWAYLHYVESLKEDYAGRALEKGWDRLDAARLSVALFFDGYVHGPLLGVAAVGGALGTALAGWRAKDTLVRASWAMVLFFPPLWIAVLLTQTPYFKPNNLLPVMPFTCLFAAWLLMLGWRRVAALASAPWTRRALAAAGVLGLLLLAARPGYLYVYRGVTPSTLDTAEEFLGRRLHDGGRLVYSERLQRYRPKWHRAHTLVAARVEVERLDALAAETLDLGDGEIFHASRLAGDNAEFFEARMARVAAKDRLILEPRWLALRGETLVVLRHPRRPVAAGDLELLPCDAPTPCFTALLPGRERGSGAWFVTLQVGVVKRRYTDLPQRPQLTIDGAAVELLPLPPARESESFSTAPLAFGPEPLALELRLPSGDYAAGTEGGPLLSFATWRRPRVRLRDSSPPAPTTPG